jgi:uncharacterized protein (DUF2147 family)
VFLYYGKAAPGAAFLFISILFILWHKDFVRLYLPFEKTVFNMNKILNVCVTVVLITLSALMVSSCGNSENSGNPDLIIGKWNTGGKRTVLEFYKTGEVYEAKVVQMKRGKDREGKLVLDAKNPNKAERRKPVLGKIVITNLKYKGNNTFKGDYYRYNEGKTIALDIVVNETENCLNVTYEKEDKEIQKKWKKNSNTIQ